MKSQSDTGTGRMERWARIVEDAELDGWLVADFRRTNSLFGRLLNLHTGVFTRRTFLWIPAPGRGEPGVIASRVDGHSFAHLDLEVTLYDTFDEMVSVLDDILPAGARVAMEYVERGALPTVSRVDAGLIELIRTLGVTVVTSGNLIAVLDVWTEHQQALHERAARGVDAARRLAIHRCREDLQAGLTVTEGALVQVIRAFFADQGLFAADGPDVAVNEHAADPHYGTGDSVGATIGRDDVLLIDLWAKVRDAEGAPYADSTWMAYSGSDVPPDVARTFEVVREARNAAVTFIGERLERGEQIRGREVDGVARGVVDRAGMTEFLIHRTGHSLGIDHVHGMGTNLDSVEFPDDRFLAIGSGLTIEPGLYLTGRYGVRSEVSAVVQSDGLRSTTEAQADITRIV